MTTALPPPVLFFRTFDPATFSGPKDADWRFTGLKRAQIPRTILALKARLIADFTDAPAGVRAVARTAWEESDATQVVARICDMLDAFRDNFASFNAAGKAWLRAYADLRGIRRKDEDD